MSSLENYLMWLYNNDANGWERLMRSLGRL